MVNLVREYRAGRLQLFAPARKPGPAAGVAPAKDRARGRVIELRRAGLSAYEISTRLGAEGMPLNRTSVAEILTEEGFGRLLRPPCADGEYLACHARAGHPPAPHRPAGLHRLAGMRAHRQGRVAAARPRPGRA